MTIGGGLAPETRQLALAGVPADNGRFFPTNCIDNGRTVNKSKNLVKFSKKVRMVYNLRQIILLIINNKIFMSEHPPILFTTYIRHEFVN